MLQYSYRKELPPTRCERTDVDQSWLDYHAIIDRPPFRWPNNAQLALWICPCVLHYEYIPRLDPWLNAWTRMPPPDVMGYGRQEYGNRVGFWRIRELLDRLGVRATAVVNSAALRLFPDIAASIREKQWDVVGHGWTNTRFIFELDESSERRYYRDMIADVERMTGVRMRGMGGPGPQSATESTPDLLAEEGFLFYTDFFCDDQPSPLRVRTGRLISMPYSVEVNDSPVLSSAFEGEVFAEIVRRQADRLLGEGAESGRVMCIALHSSLFGQPQRIAYLERALDYVLSLDGVWLATGTEIAEYYLAHGYDNALASMSRKTGQATP